MLKVSSSPSSSQTSSSSPGSQSQFTCAKEWECSEYGDCEGDAKKRTCELKDVASFKSSTPCPSPALPPATTVFCESLLPFSAQEQIKGLKDAEEDAPDQSEDQNEGKSGVFWV